MNHNFFMKCLLVLCLVISFCSTKTYASSDEDPDLLDDDYESESFEEVIVHDPFEPVNRVFFEFNDKLYFWVLKPVKKGYTAVVHEDIRYCLGNFFYNLASPVRLVNNLLQGKFKEAGLVVSRFFINTTLGVYGFGDPAQIEFDLSPQPADFGQTLGVYGVGEGIYLCWPVLGPSNIRDTTGFVADIFTHPMFYTNINTTESFLYYSSNRINSMSLSPGVYEDVKKYSLDPYIAVRQAYYDYRNSLLLSTEEQEDDF